MYRIVYDLDGGDFPTYVANPNYYTTDSGASMILRPQKNGYAFLGWTEGDSSELLETIALKKGSIGDRTFKANWKVVTYRITYDLDGGFINDGYGIDSYTIEDNDLRLPTPIKDGYWFMGWKNSDSSEPQVVYIVKQGSTGDLEVKAVWRKMHTIRYEDGSNAETTVIDGKSFEVRECQSKEGYEFVKWIGSDGNEFMPGQTVKPEGDLVLTPQRKPIAYTITYLNDGEYEDEGNPTSYTIEDSFTLKRPTREGYVFDGWVETGGSSSKDYRIEGRIGDLEISAMWRGLYKYSILYDGNGGSNSLSPVEKTEGESLILPSSGVERTGYKLAGWNTKADGSGDSYELGGTYEKNEDCKFYAVWKPIEYKITYMYGDAILKGGTEPAGDIESTYTVENLPLALDLPELKNGKSPQWRLPSDKVVSELPKGTTGDIVLTLAYELVPPYTITYDYDNGSDEALESKRYSDDPALVIAECSKEKEGYVFSHWYSDDETVYMPGDSYSTEADLKLHAYWVHECLKFELDVDGTAWKVSYDPEYTGEVESLEIPALYKGKKVRYVYGFAGKSMTSLTVQEGVLYIQGFAFEDCRSLVSVVLPANIEVYGYAFNRCFALETLTISGNANFEKGRGFSNCTSLQRIVVEGDVKLGKETFYHCRIEEIYFGDEEWAKKWTAEGVLEKANIPSTVKITVKPSTE